MSKVSTTNTGRNVKLCYQDFSDYKLLEISQFRCQHEIKQESIPSSLVNCIHVFVLRVGTWCLTHIQFNGNGNSCTVRHIHRLSNILNRKSATTGQHVSSCFQTIFLIFHCLQNNGITASTFFFRLGHNWHLCLYNNDTNNKQSNLVNRTVCDKTSEAQIHEQSMAPATANLMETALIIHSSNLPINWSQEHYTTTVTNITQLEGHYSFCLPTESSGLSRLWML